MCSCILPLSLSPSLFLAVHGLRLLELVDFTALNNLRGRDARNLKRLKGRKDYRKSGHASGFSKKENKIGGVLFHWPRTKQKLNKRLQSVHARSCRPSFVPALVKCVHMCAQQARHLTTRTTAIFGHREGWFCFKFAFGFGGGETGGLCVCVALLSLA